MEEITSEFIQAQIAKGRKYTMIFLKEGPNRSQGEEEAEELQMAHLKYLFGLRQKGLLVINGPLLTHPEIRGVGIYATEDMEEAKRLAEQDPAVKAGRLVVEANQYFSLPGSALP